MYIIHGKTYAIIQWYDKNAISLTNVKKGMIFQCVILAIYYKMSLLGWERLMDFFRANLVHRIGSQGLGAVSLDGKLVDIASIKQVPVTIDPLKQLPGLWGFREGFGGAKRGLVFWDFFGEKKIG